MSIRTKSLLSPMASFSLLYFVVYGAWGIINSYLSVYFNTLSFSKFQIGCLMSVGPAISFVGLVFWGNIADRAKSKNHILILFFAAMAVLSPFFMVSHSFLYLLILTGIFMFFYFPFSALTDGMGIEALVPLGYNYGSARLYGSVGLALLSLVPGFFMDKYGTSSLFPVYVVFALLVIVVSLTLPKVPGHPNLPKRKNNFVELLKNREILTIFIFILISQCTISFYFAFFPVYLADNGASSIFISLNNLLQFAIEIPFIYFSARFIKRFGIKYIFLFSFALSTIRMLVLGSSSSVFAFLMANFLCGIGYTIMMFIMSIYLNGVDPQLKSSAQMMITLVAHCMSRFIGNIVGGFFADRLGIAPVFMICSLINALLVVTFFIWIKKTGKRTALGIGL